MTRTRAAPDSIPLVQKIRERQATFSRAESAIAAYLVAHVREIPFETAASISRKLHVSPMTVGRFLRSMGYEGLAPLKEELSSSLHQIAWLVGERYQRIASPDRATGQADGGGENLSGSLDLELRAIVSVYEQARTARFAAVAQALADADRVYVTGFQTVRGVAQDFAQRLEYARPGVRFLEGANGTYGELFAEGGRRPVLVVVDIRRYAKQAVLLARQAGRAGIDLAIVTDSVCYWAHELTENVFQIPTDVDLFWDSNAPLSAFLNLLVDNVIRRLGPAVGDRIKRLQALQDTFESFAD
jgi:DNA-binding MurR/RpiR family transcriptional regulator